MFVANAPTAVTAINHLNQSRLISRATCAIDREQITEVIERQVLRISQPGSDKLKTRELLERTKLTVMSEAWQSREAFEMRERCASWASKP